MRLAHDRLRSQGLPASQCADAATLTLRRQVEALIPDALFAHRQGTTDSEAILLCSATIWMVVRVNQDDASAARHCHDG